MKFPSAILSLILPFIALLIGAAKISAQNTNSARPNLIIIDADDLGFGDIKVFSEAFGTANQIPTPRIDSLALQGMMFTQMHSCSALCSPSRYGLLTGRYSWRLALDGTLPSGVVGAYGQSIIRRGELTIAQFLKNQGYDTAAFGKWHLGAQWYNQQGVAYTGNSQNITSPSQIDLVRPVEGHATSVGFNSFYGLAATINEAPYVAMINSNVVYNGQPSTINTPWVTVNGTDLAQGSAAQTGVGDPNFTNNNYYISQLQCGPDMITNVVKYLTNRATNSQPFFAYVALYSPHLPLMVLPNFVGACGFSTNFPFGDYINQSDYWVGQILDALGANANNTIVVVTSDNGPENGGPFGQALAVNHDSNGPFRGVKRDSWEGGHRIPFILRWPGKVTPGTISSNLLWQGDIYATMADYLQASIPSGQAPDSTSFLPILFGNTSTNRTPVIIVSGLNQLSLHMQDGWKFINGTGGGGYDTTYDADNNKITNAQGTIGGTPKQLFMMPQDIGERYNLQGSYSYKTNELTTLLAIYTNSPSSVIPPIDTDGDTIPDYWELLYKLNPNDPNDGTNHPNGDKLTYLQKYFYGLNPLTNDTDGDGLSDYDELFVYDTNPLNPDTDGDGVNDGDEVAGFSNPRNKASYVSLTGFTTHSLPPVMVQLAGVNGNSTDPAISSNSWSGSGTFFVRERPSNSNDSANQYLRTRLYAKFDLTGIAPANYVSATMRVYQINRLNSLTDTGHSSPVELAPILNSWGTNAGALPLFSNTPVSSAIVFGRNDDFGTATTASGFYSGIPGVAGTNDLGFDPDGQISTVVSNWLNGTITNYGLRFAMTDRAYAGAAFAATNNPSTLLNEQFALLVTTQSGVTNLDANHNSMLDSQELQYFGNLNRTGTGDFDSDGISDQVELAMDSNPTNAASRPEFTLNRNINGTMQLTFQRNLKAAIGYEVQTSLDLQNWIPAMDTFTLMATQDLGNGYEQVAYTAPPTTSHALFIRLNIIIP